jgi:branched-chain amino acid transport system substrate-binding protein
VFDVIFHFKFHTLVRISTVASEKKEGITMKKHFILMSLICALSLLFAGLLPVYGQEKVEPIRIGVLSDLTGPGAQMGPKFRVLQDLFLNEIGQRAAGRPIKTFIEDSATSPAVATDKARKLISVDKVHILTGTILGSISQTVAIIAAEQKIPLIGWYGGHYEAVEKGWYFATSPPLESNTYVVGKYAYEKGYRTATCIGSDYVAGHKFVGGAMQGFIDIGGQVIQKQWVPFGTQDFSPYVAAMKPADVCLFWLETTGILTFPIQYREFGLLEKTPLIITEGDSLFSEFLLKVDPAKFEAKVSGRTSYTSDIDNPLNKKFVAAFRAKVGNDPDAYDLAAYETWMLIVKALEATKGDTNPEKLRQAIRGIKMMTPAGAVHISQEGFAFRPSYFFQFAMKDGKIYKKLIKEYPEQNLIRLRPGIAP